MKKSLLLALTLSFSVNAKDAEHDPFIWLEDIDAPKSMEWVLEQNQRTADEYKANPLYQELFDQALATLNNKSRIPSLDR